MPKSINYRQRLQIIFLHLNNSGPRLSIAKISRKMKLSRHTVSNWIKRFKETVDVLEQHSIGRPTKISGKLEKIMKNALVENPELNAKEISLQLERTGLKIHPTTISRRLNKLGYHYKVPASKPLLSKKQKLARLKFGRENGDRDWSNVIFTDEFTIKLGANRERFWKRRNSRIYLRKQKYPGKINIWGCFTSSGFGKIILFKENLNAEKMISIYEKGLLRSYISLGNTNYLLLEDNDPKHTSKKAKIYKKNHKINQISFPANSPDLNPIENVWHVMKSKVAKFHPSNISQLKSIIKKIWKDFPRKMAENLANSMTKRCKLVIDAKGDCFN